MNSPAASVVIVTGGYDHTLKFWDALNGTCYKTLQHPDSQVNCVQISPDKTLVCACGNPYVRLYETNSTQTTAVGTFEGHSGNVVACGFQKSGKWLYSGSDDGTVRVWDIRTMACQREYEHDCAVTCVALHPNQTELLSGDSKGCLRFWDLKSNKCVQQFVPEEDTHIRSVSISSDGQKAMAATNSGNVYIWSFTNIRPDPCTGNLGGKSCFEQAHKFNAHKTYILKALFSNDGKFIATTSADHTIRIWNASDYSLYKTLVGHNRWVWDCVFSADSKYLVSASSDTFAKLWDLQQGECIRTLSQHQKAIVCLAMNDFY